MARMLRSPHILSDPVRPTSATRLHCFLPLDQPKDTSCSNLRSIRSFGCIVARRCRKWVCLLQPLALDLGDVDLVLGALAGLASALLALRALVSELVAVHALLLDAPGVLDLLEHLGTHVTLLLDVFLELVVHALRELPRRERILLPSELALVVITIVVVAVVGGVASSFVLCLVATRCRRNFVQKNWELRDDKRAQTERGW